ncbi:hypothetical protein EK904_000039, partial [Melospiza melodia maxima]
MCWVLGCPERCQPQPVTHSCPQIDVLEALHEDVLEFEETRVFGGWLQSDCRPFKKALLSAIKGHSMVLRRFLAHHVTSSLEELQNFIKESTAGLSKPLEEGDYEGLVEVMAHLAKVRERQEATDMMFEPLKETVALLKTYGDKMPEEIHLLLQKLPESWDNNKKLCLRVAESAAPLQAAEAAVIRNKCQDFEVQQLAFRETFQENAPFSYTEPEPYKSLNRQHKSITVLEKEMEALASSAALFEVSFPEYKQLKMCRKELRLLKDLWDMVTLVNLSITSWNTTKWAELNVEDMDIECKKFAKDIRGLDKDVKGWNAFTGLDSSVKNMMTSLRAVEFTMSDNTTLADLLQLNLHKFEEEVRGIVDKATKEAGMEKVKGAQLLPCLAGPLCQRDSVAARPCVPVPGAHREHTGLVEPLELPLLCPPAAPQGLGPHLGPQLILLPQPQVLNALDTTWAAMEFEYEPHGRTQLPLLKMDEALIETLEDNQMQLQNVLASKYRAFFLQRAQDWQEKLSTTDTVINTWFEVQRKWSHLETIFIASEDTRSQLPEESKKFDTIDEDFRALVADAVKTPNVIECTNKPGLNTKLEALQDRLAVCEKALAEYLETKRLAFPRFYFVSSADLLDILSKGTEPLEVSRHLTKLFDSLAKLKFQVDADKKPQKWHLHCRTGTGLSLRALPGAGGGLCSLAGLELPAQLCRCAPQVEVWLNRLLECMRSTLRSLMPQALGTYEDKPREEWVFDYPAQIALTGTQIAWTTEVGVAFASLEKGYENALKDYNKKQIARLNALISLLLGNLSAGDRMKIMTICTIDVHARDVISKMIQTKSQLRHRWDDGEKHCFANICDAQLRYAYEYLGNTPRLSCGNIYKGLSQTGAWGCFDEFNRILVEVLSVIAVQVKCIQDAIRARKKTFNFLGETISLVPSVGIFITMNPGYAGRTELPENLKALFRPCAMVVPDFELICEIMLVAEGFLDARLLARKFITLYTLCKELLSKQDHYDWGLRAIKSVLVVAGSLKRGDPGSAEDQVLMRALRDFNIPKIVTDDLPVFLGLIGDLFPALDVPRKRNLEFEKVIREAVVELKLQAEENFVLKVVQLEELLQVRHSVFVVGNAGCGKSQVLKSLNKTYKMLKRRPVTMDLDPKAVTCDELFGIIHPATREWKDGLFSTAMRDLANITHDGPKWIILDGDIDPMWIESLNTVMDDNKVLTLASNERIPLTPTMRLIFEISHLRTATPATNVPPDSPREQYELFFVFACIWAFGGALFQDQLVDHRQQFSKWWLTEFKAIKFPSQGTVFDYYIHPNTKTFNLWDERVPAFELDPDVPLQAAVVHTTETIRLRYFMDLLMEKQRPVMLVGNAGTGKSVLMWDKLEALGTDEYLVQSVPLNFYTTSAMLQAVLEKPLEKKSGRVFGPPGTKRLIYFIDDMNMPEVDKYGTVAPHTLIRQHLDHGHWWVLEGHGTMGGTCAQPQGKHHSAGPHTALHQKVASNFLPTAIKFHYIFNLRDLSNIFQHTMSLKRALASPQSKPLQSALSSTKMTVRAAGFVCQGLLFSTPDCLKTPVDLVRLWLHEAERVYGDKLVDEDDQYSFKKVMADISKASFQEINEELMFAKPNIYCHFAQGMDEFKYMPVTSWASLSALLGEALDSYNEVNAAMNLGPQCSPSQAWAGATGDTGGGGVGSPGAAPVPGQSTWHQLLPKGSFPKAPLQLQGSPGLLQTGHFGEHLVGVALGGDRFSLSQLDLASQYMKAAVKNIPSVFLMTDSQVAEESFLVVINDFLASGEVPGLFQDNDMETIIGSMRPQVKSLGLEDTKENCWKLFIDKVRRQLKVVLCFSPVGSTLRVRARRFPAVVNCTAIDWFHEWPEDALVSVSSRFLEETPDIEPEVKASISQFMSFVHTSSKEMSKIYLTVERRYNYTTPKTFLEQIKLYQNLLADKRNKLFGSIDRLEKGLMKLRSTASQVDDLKAMLAVQEVELKQKNEDTDKLIHVVGVETEKVSKEKAIADEEELKVEAINKMVAEKQRACASDLAEAEVVLSAAREALDTLNKYNLTELKSFGSPPPEVVNVMAAVLILTAENGKIPKDKSWTAGKVKIGKADTFLASLKNFDGENIPEPCLKAFDCPGRQARGTQSSAGFGDRNGMQALALLCHAATQRQPKRREGREERDRRRQLLSTAVLPSRSRPYRNDPSFNPEFIKSKSTAAAGLCSWCLNMVRFYEVHCIVKPKRQAVADADAELAEAQARLSKIKSKIVALNQNLATLTAQFEKATAEKIKCQQEADETSKVINLANRLVGGLASENVRWAESVEDLKEQEKTLCGDVLLVSAFVSYIGYFTKSDRTSTENAAILCSTQRWPLLVDAQQQGGKWIKNKFGEDLQIVRLGQKRCARGCGVGTGPGCTSPPFPAIEGCRVRAITSPSEPGHPRAAALMVYPTPPKALWGTGRAQRGPNRAQRVESALYLDIIAQAVSEGQTLLIEDIGETIEAVLDPLLGRTLMGRYIRIGDKEVEYNQQFRLILHTRSFNPHYKPEVQAQCTLINFLVTREGLEDQLLAAVVARERPDLEALKVQGHGGLLRGTGRPGHCGGSGQGVSELPSVPAAVLQEPRQLRAASTAWVHSSPHPGLVLGASRATSTLPPPAPWCPYDRGLAPALGLTKSQNEFKIKLKELEDSLLARLSAAGGDFLRDTALVENLEITKRTAKEIEEKAEGQLGWAPSRRVGTALLCDGVLVTPTPLHLQVKEAKVTEVQINVARENYRPAAERASLLYFILSDLCKINPIYQFSLKAFNGVFEKAIERAVPSDDTRERVINLTDQITFSVYVYTAQGLFERDKLIFLAQVTFQVLALKKEVNPAELDFLLRFPSKTGVTSPVDFLPNQNWGAVKALSEMDEFTSLENDIESSAKRWKRFVEMEAPENEVLPMDWKNKTPLQKLCVLRCLRPDRMTYAIRYLVPSTGLSCKSPECHHSSCNQGLFPSHRVVLFFCRNFVEEKMGSKYVKGRSIDFSEVYKESSPSSPMFFILSPGVDPLKDVEALGEALPTPDWHQPPGQAARTAGTHS